MKPSLRSALLALAAVCAPLAAAEAADFANVVVSTSEDGTAQASFPADTPEIFVRADMVDVAPGSVVTVTWLAVDTGPANPPNFRISQVSLPVQRVRRLLRTAIQRPGERWPAGAYRVRLSVDNQTLERVDFRVE